MGPKQVLSLQIRVGPGERVVYNTQILQNGDKPYDMF